MDDDEGFERKRFQHSGHHAILPSTSSEWTEDEDEALALALQEEIWHSERQIHSTKKEKGNGEKEEQNMENKKGLDRVLDKGKSAIKKVKEYFEDPWKGWVNEEDLRPDGGDDIPLSEQEEEDKSIAFLLHEEELRRVEQNKTWAHHLQDIQKDRFDLFYDNRKKYKPYFLVTISVLQVLLLIANLIYSGGFEKPSLNPMLGPSAKALVTFGANTQIYTKNNHEVWRLVTPIMLHAGIIHLLSNLLVQWKIGFDLERVWGWHRVMFIYFISGIGGNIFSVMLMSNVVSVGASGALMGLYGGIVADNIINWRVMRRPKYQIIWWTVTLVIFFGLGFVPMIDNIVHTMGFITGMFAGVACLECLIRSRSKRTKNMTRAAGVLGLIVLYAVGLSVLYAVPNFHCKWCCYIFGKFNC